jgi:hypothetical protein
MYKIVIQQWTGRQWEIIRTVETYDDDLGDANQALTSLERAISSDDPYWYGENHRYAIFNTETSQCIDLIAGNYA